MVRQEEHQEAVQRVKSGVRAEEVVRRRVESSEGERTLRGNCGVSYWVAVGRAV